MIDASIAGRPSLNTFVLLYIPFTSIIDIQGTEGVVE